MPKQIEILNWIEYWIPNQYWVVVSNFEYNMIQLLNIEYYIIRPLSNIGYAYSIFSMIYSRKHDSKPI